MLIRITHYRGSQVLGAPELFHATRSDLAGIGVEPAQMIDLVAGHPITLVRGARSADVEPVREGYARLVEPRAEGALRRYLETRP